MPQNTIAKSPPPAPCSAPRSRARCRIDRRPVDRQIAPRADRGTAVERLASAAEYAAQQAGSDAESQRCYVQLEARVERAQAARRFQHFDHHGGIIQRNDAAYACVLVGADDLRCIAKSAIHLAPREHERPFDARNLSLKGERGPHRRLRARASGTDVRSAA
jgi:hypothetical protein